MKIVFVYLLLEILISNTESSAGDRSPYYQDCMKTCTLHNCTQGGSQFKDGNAQYFYLKALQWFCSDECGYHCMWKTVSSFHERNFRTPQFYGKWPFTRMFGIQEPASVLFSILNFYAHLKMMLLFRREVKADSPLYWLWHSFCLVSLNTWLWSSIFHTRDTPLTEFMDYSCAFSLVLMTCYCAIIRMLRNMPKFLLIAITCAFAAFFVNHVAYLKLGKFDYSYNMDVNLIIGTFTAFCWFGWCTFNRFRQPYVWKCAVFVALTGVVMLLEIIDMPPIFWIFDCHSLWHLSTAPLACLFYSFLIDDCKFLRKQKYYATEYLDSKSQ